MNNYSDCNDLKNALQNLSQDNKRTSACKSIKRHIESAVKELSLKSFRLFEEELHDCIVVSSLHKNLSVKLGAIAAIQTIATCPATSPDEQVTKLHSTITAMLSSNTEYSLLEKAAEALGTLARNSSLAQSDFLENDISTALSNLTSKHANRRLVGCAVLSALAHSVPTLFLVHCNQFVKVIWGPLRDSKEAIRSSAVRAVSACLTACSQRKQSKNKEVYTKIFDEILLGFRQSSLEGILSSFMVAEGLIKHPNSFIKTRYLELCDVILELKDNKHKRVKLAVISLIPNLSERYSDTFIRSHLDNCIDFLMKSTEMPDLKATSLLSIGKICRSMGSHLSHRSGELVGVLSNVLLSGQKKTRGVPTEALKCIADMVYGMGVSFHYQVLGLLDAMLYGGLTEDLIESLSVITTNMPMHKEVVHRRLLSEIVKVLEEALSGSGKRGAGGGAPQSSGSTKKKTWSQKMFGSHKEVVSEVTSSKKGHDLLLRHKGFTVLYPGPSSSPSSTTILGPSFSRGRDSTVASRSKGVIKGECRTFSSQQADYLTRTNWDNLSWGTLADDIDPIPTPQLTSSDLILLALRTLRILSVSDHTSLLMLVHRAVIPFLYVTDDMVREEAAASAAKLTAPSAKQCELRGPTAKAVEFVIIRLLEMCVTDRNTSVRVKVLKAIDERFLRHLHQPCHTSQLLFLTTDKAVSIRNLAVEILGKLADKNPALILPHLRKILKIVICDLQSGASNKIKEWAALTLSVLLRSASLRSTFYPFLGTIIHALPIDPFGIQSSLSDLSSVSIDQTNRSSSVSVASLKVNHDTKTRSQDSAVVMAGMRALGELCLMFRQDVLPYARSLLPLIIGHILDSSSVKKQEIAVKTLGRLVSATGLVVLPYLEYPQLLPSMLELLGKGMAASVPWSLRREIMRTIGLIGALDPPKYESIVSVNALQITTAEERREKGSKHSDKGDKGVITMLRRTDVDEYYLGEAAIRQRESDGFNKPVLLSRDYKRESSNKMSSIEVFSNECIRMEMIQSVHTESLVRAAISVNRVEVDVPAHAMLYELSVMRAQSYPSTAELPRLTPSSSEYYPRVTISALMKILLDSTLSIHHTTVTQAIMFIFQTLGLKCMPFLKDVVPYVLDIIRTCGPGLRESLLSQLAQLCEIAQYHLTPYVKDIFDVVRLFWNENSNHVLNLVEALAINVRDESIKHTSGILSLLLASLKVPSKFLRRRSYASTGSSSSFDERQSSVSAVVTSHNFAAAGLIDSNDDSSKDKLQINPAFANLERLLESLGVLYPVLCLNVEQVTVALCTIIDDLQSSETLFTSHTSIVALAVQVLTLLLGQEGTVAAHPHVLGRALNTIIVTMRKTNENTSFASGLVMTTVLSDCTHFCSRMAAELGADFLVYDRVVSGVMAECGIASAYYKSVIIAIRQNDFSSLDNLLVAIRSNACPEVFDKNYGGRSRGSTDGSGERVSINAKLASSMPEIVDTNISNNPTSKWIESQLGDKKVDSPSALPNEAQLQKAWDITEFMATSDWNSWFKRLTIELIRESPSPFLRSCAVLSQAHFPLAHELFQAAFVSCWKELTFDCKNALISTLVTALQANKFPTDILLIFLNLGEFMQHDVDALPIEPRILSGLAEKSLAFAKALHYREIEFLASPATTFESLINVYKKLNIYDGAVGVLRKIQKISAHREHSRLREDILMSLEKWPEALEVYEKKLEVAPFNKGALMNKIKCLTSLGRWEEALEILTQQADFIEVQASKKNESIDSSEHGSQGKMTPSALFLSGDMNSFEEVGSNTSSPSHQSTRKERRQLENKSGSSRAIASNDMLSKMAEIGARSAWSLHRWDVMDSFVQLIPAENNVTVSLMKAVLALQQGEFSKCDGFIDQTRRLLDSKISALLAESYTRAYNSLVLTQQLSELEEIGEFLKLVKVSTQSKKNMVSNTSSMSLDPITLVKGMESFRPFKLDDEGQVAEDEADFQWFKNGSHSNFRQSASAVYHSKTYCEVPTPGRVNVTPKRGCTPGDDGNLQDSSDNPLKRVADHKALLINKWQKRIRGIPMSGKAAIPYFLKILNLRRMVGEAREDIDTFKDFATLCRHNGSWDLSRQSLLYIDGDIDLDSADESSADSSTNNPWLGSNVFSPIAPGMRGGLGHGTNPFLFKDVETVVTDCRIDLEKLKLQWSLGHHEKATTKLSKVVTHLREYFERNSTIPALERVYVQCLLKYADWKVRLVGPGLVPADTRAEVLKLYSEATVIAPAKYQAWHQWGMSNYNAIADMSDVEKDIPNHHFVMDLKQTSSLPVERVNEYVLNALKGFAKAMSLGVTRYIGSVMQDMLSLLQIWFKYSEYPGIGDMLKEYLSEIPLDCWLGVLPQLIARIHHEGDVGRALLHDLLSRLGAKHAQALMFPLSVALQSPRDDRQNAAQTLLMNLRQHSPSLINQSVLVSKELIRIAILWDEEWYSTLENCSRLYFVEGNIQKMLDLLLPLHEKLIEGAQTSHEKAFMQSYGNELKEAHQCLVAYVTYMEKNNMTIPTSGARPTTRSGGQARSIEAGHLVRAWDLYVPVFKRITPSLRQIISHNMSHVSPELVDAHDLDLAIPGTYTLTGDAVRIKGFSKRFNVILSKQRPRKIRLFGLDGLEYVFLLKGHEDLRQDERAMQLFGLVNALLEHDYNTVVHDLSIQRYAVVPLSPKAGLVGWVPKCDTLHDLIRTYRQSKHVMLDVEQMLMQQLCPFNIFERLSPLQKLEIFEYALNNTSGQDLNKILWHQASSSEAWVVRRDNYTKSLAVMSVVGYILGLGDRHPSNLMLQRSSCKVVHIDFGDCFEVAMQRDKFPEKIPFRLTRMLVQAMEVSGVEGTFRLTCERVMKVLREHRFSLVAILEAFLHDPLLSWRLFNKNKDNTETGPETEVPRVHKVENILSDNHTSPEQVNVNENNDTATDIPLPRGIQRDCSAYDLTEFQDDTPTSSAANTPISSPRRVHRKEAKARPLNLEAIVVHQAVRRLQEEQRTSSPKLRDSPSNTKPNLTVITSDDMSTETDHILVNPNQERPNIHTELMDLAETCVESGNSAVFSQLKVPLTQSSMWGNSTIESFVSRSDSFFISESINSRQQGDDESIKGSSGTRPQQEVTDRAVTVLRRVLDKLTGLDFPNTPTAQGASNKPLAVPDQIDRLINEATSNENLSTCYMGWCPLW